MKNTIILFSCLLVCFYFSHCAPAKKNRGSVTTVILVRHAEKDTIGGNNPPLSKVGNARAKKLSTFFHTILPDEFYATPYIRTISTLKPWSTSVGKEIKTYAAADSLAFARSLLIEEGKTIVVAGHSNTIPGLVNLLIGRRKYPILPDTAYSNIYVVKIIDGTAKEEILHY